MRPMVTSLAFEGTFHRGSYIVQAGRPRLNLTEEQQRRIEDLYRNGGHSQAHIAQIVGVAIPRVRRHLIEAGLYVPRASIRTSEREQQLSEAVLAYQDGEKVVEICQTYEVNPAQLYQELRARKVPFRTQSVEDAEK